MGDIYKVTGANVRETNSGCQLFEIQLNNELRATKPVPSREVDKRLCELYKLFIANDESLDFLLGKYISIAVRQTRYGLEFSSVASFDAIGDFHHLLQSANGKAFQTQMNIYGFLLRKSYPKNVDGSITLKPPYASFNISSENVCYPNNLGPNHLSLDNIAIVFEEFYKNKSIDNLNYDRCEKYVLTPASIAIERLSYHKSQSRVLGRDILSVLTIGDLLNEEQQSFVSKR
ncbi:hypothetical protein [Acidovorax sp. sic0104]|uniref:hypothetical protein n=1 Tax=Acidovorax sp. sic0104 TaxID=2854784 RepID=UPI001C45F684|nr:hypothetical protein [Acidovorax sp. sic0104]MBV7541985.1 hypothetical protein [Acidovorax sp. sic0104]